MAADLPPQLHDLTAIQRGVLARAQVLSAGLSEDAIAARLRRGSWQRLYPGVYATFSGPVSRSAELWAAVLHAGPGAMLSHQTAAELWGLAAEPSSLIHVTVPGNRRVHKQAGIRLHVSVRASAAVHPSRNPPQTRLEPTVIDLWETARSLDDAVGWVTRAIGRRLTTPDKLLAAMEARGRVRWRTAVSRAAQSGRGRHPLAAGVPVRSRRGAAALAACADQAGRGAAQRPQRVPRHALRGVPDRRRAGWPRRAPRRQQVEGHPPGQRSGHQRPDHAALWLARCHDQTLHRGGRDRCGAGRPRIHRRPAVLPRLSRRQRAAAAHSGQRRS